MTRLPVAAMAIPFRSLKRTSVASSSWQVAVSTFLFPVLISHWKSKWTVKFSVIRLQRRSAVLGITAPTMPLFLRYRSCYDAGRTHNQLCTGRHERGTASVSCGGQRAADGMTVRRSTDARRRRHTRRMPDCPSPASEGTGEAGKIARQGPPGQGRGEADAGRLLLVGGRAAGFHVFVFYDQPAGDLERREIAVFQKLRWHRIQHDEKN